MAVPEKNENKGAKAVVRDRRRVDVAQDLADGVNVTDSAKNIGVSRETIYKDRKAIVGRFQSQADETVQEYRAAQLIELSELKAQLVSPAISAVKKVELALAIIDREIDLLGTKAATKTITANINADVDPEQLVGYRRFVYETRGLDRDSIESVYQFARHLSRPATVEHAPPSDSELWNEEGS
jgi:hypothetical protein